MSYTTSQLMTTVVSSLLGDGELGFVGVGTSGRAGALAVGIPLAAGRLAQLTHAPGYDTYWANMVNPVFDELVGAGWLNQSRITGLRCAAAPPDISFKVDTLARGRFGAAFSSAAQIDRYGNLNITWIRGGGRQVRLVGSLAQPEHLAFAKRVIVLMDLSPRSFVTDVDYVTSVGHRSRGMTRDELGLPGGGPTWVVTDRALFDFGGLGSTMRLRACYEGFSVDDVVAQMGFVPEVDDRHEVLGPPDAEQLRLLRQEVDPHGALIEGSG